MVGIINVSFISNRVFSFGANRQTGRFLLLNVEKLVSVRPLEKQLFLVAAKTSARR